MATATLEAPAERSWVPVPRANVRDPQGAFDSEEFALLANVPVFAEHETTVRDGRRLRFDKGALEAIVDRCNRRINETGDYAAVVLGHTPDPESEAPQPELVGYAGPFRLGTLGQPGQRQRWAILADFHVFKSDWAKVRKHPRRSPELWLEDRFEDMFLDPIALLGAEAPRLDMGLLYSASYQGRLVERYTAVAPAAGSVCPPSTDIRRRRYAAESTTSDQRSLSMNLTPEDVHQLVDALEQLDWVQYVKSLMEAAGGNNATLPPTDAPPAAPPADLAAAAPPVAPPIAPPPAPAAPDAPPAAPPVAPPVPDAASGPDLLGEPPAPPPDLAPPTASAGDGPLGDEPMSDEEPEPGPDDLGPPEEDDEEDYRRAGSRRRPRRHYQADGSVDGTDSVAAADVDGSVGPSSQGSVDGTAKYSRLQSEVEKLRGELEQERGRRVNAERYSKLSELRYTLSFDVDEEFSHCGADRMNDDQFALHCRTLEKYARRIPVYAALPSASQTVADRPPQDVPANAPPAGVGREKYRRDCGEKALAYCKRKAMAGQPVSYEATLEKLLRGESLPE